MKISTIFYLVIGIITGVIFINFKNKWSKEDVKTLQSKTSLVQTNLSLNLKSDKEKSTKPQNISINQPSQNSTNSNQSLSFNNTASASNNNTKTPNSSVLSNEEQNNINVFKNISPSVVYITIYSQFRNPFSFNVQKIKSGTGSGFIWDKEGHIITNYHVIAQQDVRYQVVLSDQSTWDAEIINGNPENEVAVIKIKAPADKLKPIVLGNSEKLQIGQKVFAIGNPFGFDYTLTTGIVSGLGREITSMTGRAIHGLVQTDAAINPGNSGGPLLDNQGNLIGMNTAIYSPSGASAGIGFAVPVSTIKTIVPRLLKRGNNSGLGIVPAPDQVSQRLGIEKGIIVQSVLKRASISKSGIEDMKFDEYKGFVYFDVISKVNNKEISGLLSLYKILDNFNPGDQVNIEVVRYKVNMYRQRITEIKKFNSDITLANLNKNS